MSIDALLANIQTPEQIKALSAKLAKAGRPPQGLPGMAAGTSPAPAVPTAAPSAPQIMANPVPPPEGLGSILGGFGNA